MDRPTGDGHGEPFRPDQRPALGDDPPRSARRSASGAIVFTTIMVNRIIETVSHARRNSTHFTFARLYQVNPRIKKKTRNRASQNMVIENRKMSEKIQRARESIRSMMLLRTR